MTNSPLPQPARVSPGSDAKFSILFGMVLALLAASVFLLYQFNQVSGELDRVRHETAQVRDELTKTRGQLLAEIAQVHETTAASTETNKITVEALKRQVENARYQAGKLAGAARVEADKHADDLAKELQRMQQEQEKTVAAMSNAVSQVKTDTDATKIRVGEVSSEVGTVRNELSATKSELDKTIAELKKTTGDLGVQSGLIATNAKQLEALTRLGERIYTPFVLPKAKNPTKIADVELRLKSADQKRNRFTLEVIADDKTVEKKDRTLNEPLQFRLSRASQPYELVVNEVKKDTISGYLSAPKLQQGRN